MKDNKLIAEFMGVRTIEIDELRSILKQNREDGFIHDPQAYLVEELQYHTSWDWLMPVVEEIESMGYEVIIAESRCKIKHNTDHSIDELLNVDIIGTKQAATYQAVLEFIKQLKERV